MSEEIQLCLRCGRKLKDLKSIEREYGPVCYKKHHKEQNQKIIQQVLENAREIDGRRDNQWN